MLKVTWIVFWFVAFLSNGVFGQTRQTTHLPDDYLSKSWPIQPLEEMRKTLDKDDFAPAELEKLVRMIEDSSPSKIKEIESNIQAQAKAYPKGDMVLLLVDLRETLLKQRQLIISAVSARMENSSQRISPAMQNLAWHIASTASISELNRLAPIVPKLLTSSRREDAQMIGIEFVRAYNRLGLLRDQSKMEEGNRTAILNALTKVAETGKSSVGGQGISQFSITDLATEVLIEAHSSFGWEILKRQLASVYDGMSITELSDSMPKALASYAKWPDPELLSEVFRIGNIVSKTKHENLKRAYMNNVSAILNLLSQNKEGQQYQRLRDYLKDQTMSPD